MMDSSAMKYTFNSELELKITIYNTPSSKEVFNDVRKSLDNIKNIATTYYYNTSIDKLISFVNSLLENELNIEYFDIQIINQRTINDYNKQDTYRMTSKKLSILRNKRVQIINEYNEFRNKLFKQNIKIPDVSEISFYDLDNDKPITIIS